MLSSRGFVPLLSRPNLSPRLLQIQQPLQPFSLTRTLISSASRNAAAHPMAKVGQSKPVTTRAAAPSPSRSATPSPIPMSSTTLNNPILLQLARSQSPTLLYESGSHFWMKFSSWSTALACYSGAALNVLFSYSSSASSSAATSALESSSWLLSPVHTAISISLAAMGSFFLLGTSNLVKTVRALPASASAPYPKEGSPKPNTAPTAMPAGSNPRLTPVLLEVAVKPLLPLARQPKILTVPPERVSLAGRVFQPLLTGDQERVARLRDKAAQKAQWQKDRQTLMTLPFRHAWRGAKAAWRGVRRGLTGGGFTKMTVGDRKCKLDVSTGWALDDGLALEALVGLHNQEQRQQRQKMPRRRR